MSKEKDGTYLCADALAVLGVMFLLGLEYFKRIGFMAMPVTSESTLPVAVRWLCLSGAMLLSACTGYVLSNKKFSWRFVRPFFRLFYIYLASSLGAMLIRRILLDQPATKEDVLEMLLHFSSTETARFAGMYIFLLLLAPFLSAAFRDLKTYQARLTFLAVLAGISTFQPMLMVSGHYVIPEWCKMLAPAAGFVGGAFVRRYARNLHRVTYLFLLIVLCALQTWAVMYICMSRSALFYPQFDSMASLPSLMVALLLLSLFHSQHRSDTGVSRFFSGASGGAIAALILGDPIIDFIVPSLEEYVPETRQLMLAGLGAVPVIYILCAVVGIFAQVPVFMIRAVFESEYEEEAEEPEPPKSQKPRPKPIRKLAPLTETAPEFSASTERTQPEISDEKARAFQTSSITQTMKVKRVPDAVLYAPPYLDSVPVAEPIYEKTQREFTLNDILEEQGIAMSEDYGSVDDLIAKITNEEQGTGL